MMQSVEELSSFYTRLSSSTQARDAQHYLEERYKGYGFSVETYAFNSLYSEDVIAEKKGTVDPSIIIVVGAHYDSRSTSLTDVTLRAPGADDNASGTSNLLELARIISENNVNFEYTLRLCSFSGEEQGLVGSRAYAKFLAEQNAQVKAMFNGDMLGYKLPNFPITLGMKDRYVDFSLLEQANQLTRLYVPDLPIGLSASCCSDHQAFTENGFSAIGFFEHTGAASDYPSYHRSTDVPANLNPTQLGLEAQAIMASAFTYAAAYTK